MVELLARAAANDQVCGQSLDVGGPDVVSYGELIDGSAITCSSDGRRSASR